VRRAAFTLLVLFAGAAHAAEPALPAKPPETRDLVHQLEGLAGGKPLPVVAVSDRFTEAAKPVVAADADGLLATLQDIGDAFSSRPTPEGASGEFREEWERRRLVYQPYAFDTARGKLWTVASDRMWAPTDPPRNAPGMLDGMRASRDLFSTMDAAQLTKAGRGGLGWKDLTPAQQAALRSMLAHPWAITTVSRNADGKWTTRYLSTSDTPVPIEECILHLSIGFESIGVTSAGEDDDGDSYPQNSLMPVAASLDVATGLTAAMQRLLPNTPHALKPSDLRYDLPALAKPIGLQGITTIGKIVAAAAASSGLPLVVDARWKDRAAFVGDAAAATGDVLRAAAFAVDGAWRKIGGVFLFTWDREGLSAAVLRMSHDSAASDMDEMMAEERLDAVSQADWVRRAWDTLPADSRVPVKPNAAQIAALLAPPAEPSGDEDVYQGVYNRPREVFQWSRLDASQQSALRDAASNGDIGADASGKPFDAALLPQTYLWDLRLHATLDIPGAGAVEAGSALGALFLDLDGSDVVMRAYHDKELAREKAEQAAKVAKPLTFGQSVRAVEAPPMPAAEWTRLLDQMRRKGLNTLYVPVLWDGMTMFPSAHFPETPVYKGADMLASVLKQATARHIRVIAVIHALAWRFPASKAHWLTGHPELVDVDVAGQGRWDWRASVTDDRVLRYMALVTGSFQDRSAAAYADYVRPSAPEGANRLLGLIAELRRYPGLGGVALADWTRFCGTTPGASDYSWGEGAPPLGYTAADRSAFLKRNGVDPADLDPLAFYVRRTRDMQADAYQQKWTAFRYAQDKALAERLLAAMNGGWPGAVQLISFLQPSADIVMPAADILVTWDASAARGRKATYRRVTLAMGHPMDNDGGMLADATPTAMRAAGLKDFDAALHEAAVSARASGIFHSDGVVLDLTASPDLMWDGLKLLPDAQR
jgi:hypothetical protein